MSDPVKHLHVVKNDISSLSEAINYARKTIEEERLCEYSLNISEMASSTSRRSWYEVQIEGRVRNGESADPDQHRTDN